MVNRWVWIAAILVGGATFWGVGFLVQPNSGDEEFKKMLESMKQVKSFRGVYIAGASSGLRSENLWEVDCNRGIVHKQSRDSQTGSDAAFEMKDDELLVGSDLLYTRERDGSWEKHEYKPKMYSGAWYCDNLAQGTLRDLLPDVLVMLRHAMIGKGDKKTVNGVRCQEWEYAMKSATSGQQGSVCIGLEDHLPYEMTINGGGRYAYSDYNQPIQFDAPDAILQSGETQASN